VCFKEREYNERGFRNSPPEPNDALGMKFIVKDEGGHARTSLVLLEWVSNGSIDMFYRSNEPDYCQLSAKIEWLHGYDFKWLGARVNEFGYEKAPLNRSDIRTRETNQIALYFDGQFAIDGIEFPEPIETTIDPSVVTTQ